MKKIFALKYLLFYLLAAFISLAYTLPARAQDDDLFGKKPSCEPYDLSCRDDSTKLFDDDKDKEDRGKSSKPQKAAEPRSSFDPPKKSSSIGDSIREQLKPR